MIANAFWTPFFRLAGITGFTIAFIVIILILVTALIIMMKSHRNTVNITELITLRIGTAVYSGWVTAATILNVAFILKELGMSEANGVNEELATVIMLWIALVVYTAA